MVAACTGGGTSSAPASSAPASTAGSSASASSSGNAGKPLDLTIGGVVPLTGAQAPFGAWEQKSVELGVKALNDAAKASGVPLTVTAKIEDEGAGPDVSTQAATKLVTAEGATCIVGPNNSADGIAIAKNVTVPRKVPVIGILTTSPSITTLADDGYYFRTTASDSKQAIVLANFASQELGGAQGKTLNIGARNDAFGAPLADGVAKHWQELGGTVGQKVLWDPNATTYDADAQKLMSGSPAGWVIIDFVTTFQKVAPALVRTGNWDPTKTFVSALQVPQLPDLIGKDTTEGLRGLAPGVVGDTALDKSFIDYWNQNAAKVTLGAGAVSGFDGAILCGLAAVAAGSTDGSAIRDKLTPVSGPPGDHFDFTKLGDALKAVAAGTDIDYDGVYGPIDFDQNGDVAAGHYGTIEFKDGKLTTTGLLPAP
jgi:branched-chain amino acid transport system substrate-binding protein